MKKIQMLDQKLSAFTRQILSSNMEWKKFLAVSGRFAKYPFHQQIQIYFNSPETKGVADDHVWLEELKLRYKKYTHGFDVIDKSNADHPVVRRYHKIEDVYPYKKESKVPEIFVFPKEDIREIVNRLSGMQDHESDPEIRLWNWIGTKVNSYSAERILEALKLWGLELPTLPSDRINTEKTAQDLRDFMRSNISYELFARYELDLQKCDALNHALLAGNPYGISVFTSADENVINYFGDVSTIIFRAIYDTVKKQCKEILKEQESQKQLKEQKTINASEHSIELPVRELEMEDIPSVPPVPRPDNFRITDDALGTGGAKEKFRNNLAAIKTLHQIEQEHRYATEEEQQILSGYVGWGGLAEVFDETKEHWKTEYEQLKTELTPDEYKSACGSVLNAHYTAPAVIREMYRALEKMGFESGNVLEPSCGIGNFFGMLPESMRNSKLFGVELDDVSGRIAKQLYPDADIAITGYEKTRFPNNFFDVVVGNVPFGDYKVADRAYDKYNFMIHDYFIARGLDQLRPGGVMAVITSSGTMDKTNASARTYFAERAKLLGAIRLPDHAFKANAGTTVTTDVLFFQKYDGTPEPNPSWLNSKQNISDDEPLMAGDAVSYRLHRWAASERRAEQKQAEGTILSAEIDEYGNTVYKIQNNEDKDDISEVYSVNLIHRGIPVYTCNQYFQEHPEMVLGELTLESGPFGDRLTCKNVEDGVSFSEKFQKAVANIQGQILPVTRDEALGEENKQETIAADPAIKNYSYAIVDGELYFRQDSLCYKQYLSDEQETRIRALIDLRDSGYDLLNMELDDQPMEAIRVQMQILNEKYDAFVEQYGRINDKVNQIFKQDASSGFVRAFEVYEDGMFNRKADLFEKRTVTPHIEIESVETAGEALMVSLSEKGRVDLPYMASLMDKNETPETVAEKLSGIIFRDPEQVTEEAYSGYVTADAYLSGNIRNKLSIARTMAEEKPEYRINIEHLESVMPEPLDASEIDVRLGATWIKPEYIEEFMQESFQLPKWRFYQETSKSDNLQVSFAPQSVEWHINNKRIGQDTPLAVSKYGTSRKNGLEILENALNLRDTKVYDRIVDEDGKEKSVLNKKETALCNAKAELLRNDFESWVFKDPDRRMDLVHTYNEHFNNIRTRKFDGSFLTFPGMNPDVNLRTHQKDAVARTLFGGNTLLAHVVGAGKTYTMAASAMEAKRIGIAHKSLFVVPNHLTEQWGKDFLKLYPAANILVARKEDFLPDNRRTFCSRIATGDYDAIIIGHSQFERIPLSENRQKFYIESQINNIIHAIHMEKEKNGSSFTVKQLQKAEKKLTAKLERLNNTVQKDGVVTFEQLGIDRLYVDESHYYKNLFLYTKMSNVAGVQQTEAAKSSDMYMKCRYMDEVTGGKGITFATGTPISNSMTELYTNMCYLQADTLRNYGLEQFDAWAANFGNVVTAIELSPEGSGYRAKKRFSSFFNIPELMSLWHESADVQTSDMLKLPVPKAHVYNIQTQPSSLQREMVAALSERADMVRNQQVDPSEDNMLKITNDGRKLALDQRLIHPDMPDMPNSKVNACVDNSFAIWERTKEDHSAQLIFCDLSTPKGDGTFNIYDDIRNKLVEKGVPDDEIAFIHEAKTELQKDRLFQKVRNGDVRFLLGSTFKMGAGTNVQDRLIAIHHLDVPWRPSDIEQREGRIIRQGNKNPEVDIYRYVTADTFDAYSWQLIENKQKFISQIMTSKSPVRKCADIDDSALSYAEVKALATGNPYIKEKMELDVSVTKLKMERSAFESEKYRLQDQCRFHLPKKLEELEEKIAGMKADIASYQATKPENPEVFAIKLGDQLYTDRTQAGEALLSLARKSCSSYSVPIEIGNYLGFSLKVSMEHSFAVSDTYVINLQGELAHKFDMSVKGIANFANMTKILNSMSERLENLETEYSDIQLALEAAQTEVERPFEKEEIYQEQLARLKELDELLNISENADSELASVAGDGTMQDYVRIKSSGVWEMYQDYDKDEHTNPEKEELPMPKVIEFVNFIESTQTEEDTNESARGETEKLLYVSTDQKTEPEVREDGKYRLEFSTLGNGVTAWNRNAPILEAPYDKRYKISDFETIAYISPDGKNTTFFQDENSLPEYVCRQIEEQAKKQENMYRPENVKLESRSVVQDISQLSAEEILKIPGIERAKFEVQQFSRSYGIDSGNFYLSGSIVYDKALNLFLNLNEQENRPENVYVVIGNETDEPIRYQISHRQVEFYAHQEVLKEYGKDGVLTEPLVVIGWSESHAFEDGEIMPFREAEIRFAGYDQAQNRIRDYATGEYEFDFGYYEKTKFYVVSDDVNGLRKYEGRYDIGDNDGGILAHIHSLQSELATSEIIYATNVDLYGVDVAAEKQKNAKEFVEKVVPELQTYCRYEIKETGTQKSNFLYQIYDHFKWKDREFGEIIKSETGENLYFQSAREARSYLETELGMKKYRTVHHAVQNRAISKAEHEYIQAKVEHILEVFPLEKDQILEAVQQAGYIKEGEDGKAQTFIKEFYVVDDRENRRTADEKIYPDLDTALAAYFAIPNHMQKEIGIRSTEERADTMSFIECRNGIDTYFNSWNRFMEWSNDEVKQVAELMEQAVNEHGTAVAYEITNGYMTIQTSDEGYDYIFYDDEYREVDGGKYNDPSVLISDAVRDLLDDKEISIADCKVTDYEAIIKKIDEMKVEIDSFHEQDVEVFSVDNSFSYMADEKKRVDGIPFEKAVGMLVLDRVFGRIHEGKIVHMSDSNMEFVICKHDGKIVMPVSKIDEHFHLNYRPELRELLASTVKKARAIQIEDPYNLLQMPYEQYAMHEEDNPWKNPALMYSIRGIGLTSLQKEKLEELNRKCGFYLKATDIQKIALGKRPQKDIEVDTDTKKMADSLSFLANEYEELGQTSNASLDHDRFEDFIVE